MKIKLALFIFAAACVVGITPARADDPHLRNLLTAKRHQSGQQAEAASVALYSHGRGLSSAPTVSSERGEVKLQQRWNARGERIFVHAPASKR